jgi:hypothetical protein
MKRRSDGASDATVRTALDPTTFGRVRSPARSASPQRACAGRADAPVRRARSELSDHEVVERHGTSLCRFGVTLRIVLLFHLMEYAGRSRRRLHRLLIESRHIAGSIRQSIAAETARLRTTWAVL